MEFTGERYLPWVDDSIINYEHLHRYRFATELTRGKKVLDLACGEGYGSFMLAEEANEVIGIDIDEATIKHASSRYEKENLRFIKGSITDIPIKEEKTFDVIVCFEALEHIKEHDELMREVKRLLKTDGIFIVSTPNKYTYTDEAGFRNPFHLKELYFDEFKALLKDHFTHTTLYGQKVYPSSNIFPLSKGGISTKDYVIEKGENAFLFVPFKKKEARYFIAISSDHLIKGITRNSYLVDVSQTLLKEKDIHITHLEGVVREREIKIENLMAGLSEKERILDEAVNLRDSKIVELSGVLSERNNMLEGLKTSLQQKEAHLAHQKGIVREKETQIGNLENDVKGRDTQISTLDAVIKAREIHVSNLEADITEKDARIFHLEGVVREKKASLNHIFNSHGWRALLVYYRARDRVFPMDTKRRLFAKIIFNATAHPKGLFGNLNKTNIKKFSYYFRNSKPTLLEEKIRRKISEISKMRKIKPIKVTIDKEMTHEESEKLNFPFFEKPVVSIIIPLWNNWPFTFNCLDSILKNTNEVPYEVIVVDNGSSDETPFMLKKVNNIKLINNSTNIGFIDACNMGTKVCNGKYILILNNDTQVTKGWLESMVELAEKDKSIGIVGAKLIYPDGKLQEAGGIVWNDPVNLAWNYGRYDDPDNYEYNYVKQVDYCSAACLLIKKELFERIGLFDKRFAPAYWEDTDLAFSIRKLGYKVMYQPKSVVVHFEGTTAGVNLSQGYKSYQVVNQNKFYEKWKDTLISEHFKNGVDVFLARDRSQQKKAILVIDHYVPTYDKDAGSLRMFSMLKILSELGHKVTFLGDNLLRMEPYTEELQQEGVEVIYTPYVKSVEDYIREYGRYFSMVILSRPHIAIKYMDMVKSHCPTAKIVYDTVDLGFLRESRRAQIENSEKLFEEAEKLKSTELYLARNSDITLAVSPEEKALLLKEDPSLNVEIVSIIHQITKPRKLFSQRKDILFVGGFAHLPNVDSALFFVKEIFPLVKHQLPDLYLYIVGSNPPEQVLALKSSDIIVTGYVKDLTSYFENCKVFVAPLRYGAGVKGKIIQSMSHGLPVVTTSIGAEGVGLTDGTDVLIADTPEKFSEKAILLYTDGNLWNKVSQNSLENVEKHYSWEVAKGKLKELASKDMNGSGDNVLEKPQGLHPVSHERRKV